MLYVPTQSSRCETYLLLGKCLVKSIGYRWDTQVKTKPRVHTKTPILVPDSLLFCYLECFPLVQVRRMTSNDRITHYLRLVTM